MVLSIKLFILKKGEDILWTMKMEQYLAHTDYALWEVILNGNGKVHMTKDEASNEVEVSLVTTQQILARTRERIAKSTLLMAILDEHLARFHGIKYAKTLCDAIKTKFCDKRYDRFQRLLSLLEIHGVDNLDIDDLYNNLKVYEVDIKGSSGSSSNSQNVAFISVESTSSTNKLNAAYSVSAATGHSSQAQDDLEKIDLKWQVDMLYVRVKRFYKKTGRKLEFNGKEPIGFDKTKVECFNCHRRGHFVSNCKIVRNPGNRGRDARNAGYRGRDNGNRPEEATNFALMAFTSNPSSALSSNSKVQSCSKQYVQSYEQLKYLFDEQREKLRKAILETVGYQYGLKSIERQLRVHQQNKVIYEEKIRVLEYDIKDKSNLLKYTQKKLDEALREKEDLKAKLEKFETSFKNLTKLIDSQISAKVKTGLGYDCQFNEKEEEVTKTVFEENSLANDRFKQGKGFHAVPPPLTGNYMPPKLVLLFAGLDDSIYKFKISETVTSLFKDVKVAPEASTAIVEKPKEVRTTIFTRSGRIPVSAAKPKGVASTNAAKPVNITGPKHSVNFSNSRSTFHKSHSPKRWSFYNATEHSRSNSTNRVNTTGSKVVSVVNGNRVTAVKALACCVWRPRVNEIDQISKENRDLDEFCEMKGIKREYSIARTLQQNGVAKRKNRTLIEAARTMLADSLLPITFWTEAVNTTCYVLNSTLVTKPHNKTSYELLNGPQDTNGNAGTQDNVDVGKEISDQHHIVLPLWSSISSTYKILDDKAENDKPKDDIGSKTAMEPFNKEHQACRYALDRLMSQENEASDNADSISKEFRQGFMDKRGAAKAGSTNSFNIVSNLVNAASTLGTFSTGGPSSLYPNAFIPHDTLLHVNQDDS
nr:ribonuclease H-like domain-containing protein [Tanacetum cinerariifolium]